MRCTVQQSTELVHRTRRYCDRHEDPSDIVASLRFDTSPNYTSSRSASLRKSESSEAHSLSIGGMEHDRSEKAELRVC